MKKIRSDLIYDPIPAEKVHAEWMQDPEYRREYEALEPEFKLIESLIRARLKKKMSQKQLAEKIGTKQSAISRLEGGTINPSFQFLKKVATALDAKLSVTVG